MQCMQVDLHVLRLVRPITIIDHFHKQQKDVNFNIYAIGVHFTFIYVQIL